MKKFTLLILGTILFLTACRPPIPDVAQVTTDADPTTIVPLTNEVTDAYFRSALPFVSSPTRGLIYGSISNRADIEQVEQSLLRLATNFFSPEEYYFREGQFLTRDFVLNVLRANNPEPTLGSESSMGLNPAFGTELNFGAQTFTTIPESPIRPFAYVLEHNFVTIHANEFHLEGVAIAIALNPYYREINQATGWDHHHRMQVEDLIAFGQDVAANLLPLLRRQEGLDDVPIMIGLFILRRDIDVLPGNFAAVAYAEASRSAIGSWQMVQEEHFSLPSTAINPYDFNINDEFDFFANAMRTSFPHQHGLTARAQVVDSNIYRINLNFNMTFLGFSEKIAFFQLLELEVMRFSAEYDIRIIVRSPDTIHGSVVRRPHSEPVVTRISW